MSKFIEHLPEEVHLDFLMKHGDTVAKFYLAGHTDEKLKVLGYHEVFLDGEHPKACFIEHDGKYYLPVVNVIGSFDHIEWSVVFYVHKYFASYYGIDKNILDNIRSDKVCITVYHDHFANNSSTLSIMDITDDVS